MAKAVLLDSKGQFFYWESLNQIIPGIEQAWKATGQVLVLDVGSPLAKILTEAASAEYLIFPAYVSSMGFLVKTLRETMRSNVRFIFHTHGEATAGFYRFDSVRSFLTTADTFVCASRAEARTVKLCYPNASTKVVPFALSPPTFLGGSRNRRAGPVNLVYAGRISEQKNLHSLLLALWIFRQRNVKQFCRLRLNIFGRSDRMGSPNMGMSGLKYERALKALIDFLDLKDQVVWHGFVQRREIEEHAKQQGIYVSTSLHSDEDFGVAAADLLSAGVPAILSAWGGHLDFKRTFKDRVILIPVRGRKTGPFVCSSEIANVLGRASKDLVKHRPSLPLKAEYSVPKIARSFRSLLEKNSKNTQALKPSQHLEKILRRRKIRQILSPAARPKHPAQYNLADLRCAQIFKGYGDKTVQPFFKCYGMRSEQRRSSRHSKMIFVPWLKVEKSHLVVRDPHRGEWRIDIGGAGARGKVYDIAGREYSLPHVMVRRLYQEGLTFPMTSKYFEKKNRPRFEFEKLFGLLAARARILGV